MAELGFPLENSYVENQRYFFHNEAPAEVKVFVESADDVRLWHEILEENESFIFNIQAASSFVSDGKSANGCKRLQKLIDTNEIILGKYQIACMDSDYSYLLSLGGISISTDLQSEYIFKTGVHSRENFYCHPNALEKLMLNCLAVSNKDSIGLCFHTFHHEFSHAIFEELILSIFIDNLSENKDSVYVGSFLSALSKLLDIKHSDLADYKKSLVWLEMKNSLEDLKEKSLEYIESNDLSNKFNQFKEKILSRVSKEDFHFFIRGHNLNEISVAVTNCIHCYQYGEKVKSIRNSTFLSGETINQRIKELRNDSPRPKLLIDRRDIKIAKVTYFEEYYKKLQLAYNLPAISWPAQSVSQLTK